MNKKVSNHKGVIMNADVKTVKSLVARGETLKIEFKSDKAGLPDRGLIAAVISLANTEGGDLLLGVEDDGAITGLKHKHSDPTGLAALIANRTIPSLSVRVEIVRIGACEVARIQVPKSRQLVATTEGLLQRRRLLASGKPEAVPFYPHEFWQRQSSLGLADPSANPLHPLTPDVFNPLERQRIRESIRRYGGDAPLISLEDSELDGALGLTVTVDGIRRPTLAGLLFLGREDILRRHVPAHEVAFQVLEGTEVKVNEFFHKPLLQTFEEIEQRFSARIEEKEFQRGLFRVAVPNFDRRAFREAFVNALMHRDYTQIRAVYVRIDDSGLTISNPGGFMEGITLQNLLVTEPRARNLRLADIAKRIGLAERTGRGIDKIFEGLLRYGRPMPDYSRSDTSSVVLRISNAEADLNFLKFILCQEEKDSSHNPIPLDSLLVLSQLRQERRLTTKALASLMQKPERETRAALEKLTEAGLVEAHGTGRGRAYTLSKEMYAGAGQKTEYVRRTEFEPTPPEQMILNYLDKHGSIKTGDAAEL
ncbi:MAG: putative DNA binding domain-containing protein, partial [Desulfovibrio sp.]|nr:putative DNA binding domain-containing protein [Desulfovibrio sp.]